ncbi:hypothetical protein [Pseudanabaena sp. PCC 6802]|nr:hypothetical protein [Pseudanabaena sp. PCC 6802]
MAVVRMQVVGLGDRPFPLFSFVWLSPLVALAIVAPRDRFT